jgi:biotin transport system substrate-specific component
MLTISFVCVILIFMKNVKKLVAAGIMTAIMAVMANIAVPFSGIVLSLGTLGVFLTGMVLTPRYALLSSCAYLLLGICGVPVFASFASGVGTFLGPTGGFLVAYPIMALFIALGFSGSGKNNDSKNFSENSTNSYDNSFSRNGKKYIGKIFGVIAALAVCYAFGGGWYAYYSGVGLIKSLTIVALPFLPFDLGKTVLAAVIAGAVKKSIKM